jgi:cold shock protein
MGDFIPFGPDSYSSRGPERQGGGGSGRGWNHSGGRQGGGGGGRSWRGRGNGFGGERGGRGRGGGFGRCVPAQSLEER